VPERLEEGTPPAEAREDPADHRDREGQPVATEQDGGLVLAPARIPGPGPADRLDLGGRPGRAAPAVGTAGAVPEREPSNC